MATGRLMYSVADYVGRTSTITLNTVQPAGTGLDFTAWNGDMLSLKSALSALTSGTQKSASYISNFDYVANPSVSDLGAISRQQWTIVYQDNVTGAVERASIGTADTDELLEADVVVIDNVIHIKPTATVFVNLAAAFNSFVLSKEENAVTLLDIYFRTTS